MALIAKVYDANVYINNASKFGQASEVTLPDVNYIMNEYNALGMVGTPKFFNGIEAMEATFKWTYPDNEAQIALANPTRAVDFMVRSSKAVYDNGGLVEEQPVAAYIRGYSTKHPGGNFAGKQDVEVESTIAVNYFKLEINGEEIIEVDAMNPDGLKVNGVSVLAERKTNLGL